MSPRALVVVLDGVGVGALPDAGAYGDAGANTLGNVLRAASPRLPNLASLGLLHTLYGDGTNGLPSPSGAFGRLAAVAPGKDTTSGHWELMGLPVAEPFPTFPDGFPPEVLERVREGHRPEALGNRAGSGLVLLDELGAEHVKTGRPIVYTSSDSVFQISAHEEIVPVETLYALVRGGPGRPRRASPRRPRHRATVRRRAGQLPPDRPPARLRRPSAGGDPPRPPPGSREAGPGDREGRRGLRGPGRDGVDPDRFEPRRDGGGARGAPGRRGRPRLPEPRATSTRGTATATT